MNQEEIVEIIAAEHGIPKVQAKSILRTFINTVQVAVVRGDKVTLAGFGVFHAINRQPRLARNPQTGETMKLQTTRMPKFNSGQTFKTAVRYGLNHSDTAVESKTAETEPG